MLILGYGISQYEHFILGIYYVVLSISRYGWLHWHSVLSHFRVIFKCLNMRAYLSHHTPSWYGVESEKIMCWFDLHILRSYGYIPVDTEYNLVYTMSVQNQGQLKYFVLHGSVLLLDHASVILLAQYTEYIAACSQKWRKHVCRQ
jgi:hypothetical protein